MADLFNEEEQVRSIFVAFANNQATILNRCIQAFEPEVIVLGGNISNAFPLFV